MYFVVDLIVRVLCWMFVCGAMAVGMAFILSKTVERMPNKASRFLVSFALGMPFGIVYDYSRVWLLGHTTRSWDEQLTHALAPAFLFAIVLTLWPPLSRNSNTQ